MAIVLDGTSGITNDSGYTGDGVSFADSTPANTLVTTSGGNVGIGTSSPSRSLSIDGGAGTQTWTGYQQAGTEKFVVGLDGSGNPSLIGTQNAPMILYTNNTERMRIDSAGRVTMPYQPAFRAKPNASTTYTGLGSGAVVQHNTAQLNVGSHFSTSTFRFTAPVSGVYFFSWGHLVQTKSSSGSVFSNIYINGTRMFPQAWQKSSSGEFAITYSAVFFMNAGDYAEHGVSSSDSSVTLYHEETGFSGYLLG